jgi:hypothetical protein
MVMKITLEVDDSSPCYECGKEVPFDQATDEATCAECGTFSVRRGFAVFLDAIQKGYLLDVRAGGLILGRNDNEDDIGMLQFSARGILQLCGRMQGGEYILNRMASAKYKDRLLEMNDEENEYIPLSSVPLNANTRIFNSHSVFGGEPLAFLIEPGQFIMRRSATSKYLSELGQMNNSVAEDAGGLII